MVFAGPTLSQPAACASLICWLTDGLSSVFTMLFSPEIKLTKKGSGTIRIANLFFGKTLRVAFEMVI